MTFAFVCVSVYVCVIVDAFVRFCVPAVVIVQAQVEPSALPFAPELPIWEQPV